MEHRLVLVIAALLVGCGGHGSTQSDAAGTCGDGIVEGGEQCDDGANNGMPGDGCKADCTFLCVNPASDCDAPPPCQVETCSANHACELTADAAQNGNACGAGVCTNGTCVGGCGDGVVETGEQCDFGTGNGPGTGCESNCMFSCTMVPSSCDDGNPCNGLETCNSVTVSNHVGQKCAPGTPEPNGTSCGTGKLCIASACTTATCGDGYTTPPEECDDGANNGKLSDGCTTGCRFVCVSTDATRNCTPTDPCAGQGACNDATHTCTSGTPLMNGTPCGNGGTCQGGTCTQPVCGDGVRSGTEQCDDGNLTNLDGCDASCKFEQIQRMNTLSIPFAADAYCTKNALGTAVTGGNARNSLTMAIATGITSGSITIIFDALGLADLTGTTAPSFNIGVLGGTPQTGMATYNGNSDLDWWYTPDPNTIDLTRTANTKVPSSITASVLNGGPSEISVTVNFTGVVVVMDMFGTVFRATVGASTKPTSSTGMTPGHLAAEHLDPNLTSFATMTAGEMCGNTTAKSLADVLAPSALVGCGFGHCTQCYTTSNTLLDVYISGCDVTLVGQQVAATQPDTARTPGDVYHFTADPTTHKVTSCTKNGMADTLTDCVAKAGYTSLFRFTTDRVIAK